MLVYSDDAAPGCGYLPAMSLLHRTSPAPSAPRQARTAPATWPAPQGAYVTDEQRLFRVARALTAGGQRLLELEDCRTLELVLCPASALARVGLRRVVPTPGA